MSATGQQVQRWSGTLWHVLRTYPDRASALIVALAATVISMIDPGWGPGPLPLVATAISVLAFSLMTDEFRHRPALNQLEADIKETLAVVQAQRAPAFSSVAEPFLSAPRIRALISNSSDIIIVGRTLNVAMQYVRDLVQAATRGTTIRVVALSGRPEAFRSAVYFGSEGNEPRAMATNLQNIRAAMVARFRAAGVRVELREVPHDPPMSCAKVIRLDGSGEIVLIVRGFDTRSAETIIVTVSEDRDPAFYRELARQIEDLWDRTTALPAERQ